MEITLELIPKIEKALNIKLYNTQIEDLINLKNYYPKGRRSGKTTVYIIRLALSEGEPLQIYNFRSWTDRLARETNYTSWFEHQFMDIRESLRDNGFAVRKLLRGN